MQCVGLADFAIADAYNNPSAKIPLGSELFLRLQRCYEVNTVFKFSDKTILASAPSALTQQIIQ